MSKKIRSVTTIWILVCAFGICASGASAQQPIKPPTRNQPNAAAAQSDEQEDETRQIYFDYTESRPHTAAAGGAKAAPKRKRRYLRKTPKTISTTSSTKDTQAKVATTSVTINTDSAQVGVTIWKLRPSSVSDEKETRILDQEDSDDDIELTPVRIEAESPLKIKDKVRLSIESPRAGFLYVIDRELYADGTMSDPYLIFPTLGTRGGDNNVRAGMLVDIPAQSDRIKFFTMKPSRPDQVGEVLTIVITPAPLDVPPLQRRYINLDEKKVAQWEREWKAVVERFEMEGGVGQAWTKEERVAGADQTRLLDQEDPAPQTIYKVAAKLGAAVMITVPLRYAENASSESKSKTTTSPKQN